MDRMGADFEKSYKSILARLSKKAVRLQLPWGSESNLKGVVDLMKMKAYTFEGEMGTNVIEHEIPESHKAEAEKYRLLMVEKIAEFDDALTADYLDGKEISIEEVDTEKTLRKKLAILTAKLAQELVSKLKNNNSLKPIPQNEKEATYFPKFKKIE
jgi:elongation factor G